jgi:hypothetical protein
MKVGLLVVFSSNFRTTSRLCFPAEVGIFKRPSWNSEQTIGGGWSKPAIHQEDQPHSSLTPQGGHPAQHPDWSSSPNIVLAVKILGQDRWLLERYDQHSTWIVGVGPFEDVSRQLRMLFFNFLWRKNAT